MQRKSIKEQLLDPSPLPEKREYCDMLTGTTPNRHDYQLMLADAEAGVFSHLGLYRADRFGRNAAEGLQAATKLIGLGIKIRVAHMPTLAPETPDGFFMFLIQMGLAQREVDVLRQRTYDGMQAKLLAGGWAQKAPEGYLNKERQVKSNKYERWVEMDPKYGPELREAWDLLLTGRYTLVQICEELDKRGRMRQTGRPWIWTDSKTGKRKTADNRLHRIFHNPFYAGWVVSERFGIAYGEVRGNWEPIVTTQEYERGLEILHKNDNQKSRSKKHFYLLRNLLWLRENGRTYKMYVSTPSGNTKSYSYYLTHAKIEGKKIRIQCGIVDEQIPAWLSGITIKQESLPAIREHYRNQVMEVTHTHRLEQLEEARRRITQLREEEARLGRLLIMEKISETVYDQLRLEWTEKIQNAEQTLANAEREAATHLDDLDSALSLMTIISKVYELLANKQRANLLRILIKRLIVDRDGLIINHELNSPFAYLHSLVVQDLPASLFSNGSSHIHQKGNQSPRSHSSFSDVETFLAGLRFEKRNLLNDLPGNLLNGKLN